MYQQDLWCSLTVLKYWFDYNLVVDVKLSKLPVVDVIVWKSNWFVLQSCEVGLICLVWYCTIIFLLMDSLKILPIFYFFLCEYFDICVLLLLLIIGKINVKIWSCCLSVKNIFHSNIDKTFTILDHEYYGGYLIINRNCLPFMSTQVHPRVFWCGLCSSPFYTPRKEVVGGYTGFTMSDNSSVRL